MEEARRYDSTITTCKIDSQNPGSDVVAEIDATLAATFLVFHKTDPSYSKRLIHASMMVNILQQLEIFNNVKNSMLFLLKFVTNFLVWLVECCAMWHSIKYIMCLV